MRRQKSCEGSEDSGGARGQRNEARAKNNLRWRSRPGARCGARRYRPHPARERSRGRSAFSQTTKQPKSELNFYGQDCMKRSNEEDPKPSNQQTAAVSEEKFKYFRFPSAITITVHNASSRGRANTLCVSHPLPREQ